MNDTKRALELIVDRQGTYKGAESYYKGQEGEVFSNNKWRRLFNRNSSAYVLNYSKVVVDTVLDRLEIASVQAPDETTNAKINEIWEQNELTLDATEIHRQALIYGECYAIVWPDETGEVQIDYNSPLTTVMIYDDENPRKKSYAVKMWETTNAFDKPVTKLNIYYDDRVEKYTAQGTIETLSNTTNQWNLSDTIDNPFEEVPVFHFRTHRPYGTPEHEAAIGPQDAINKLVINHMNTVDYQGAPQRYALSAFGNSSEMQDFDDDDTARENIAGLQNSPGSLWYLNGVTQVGQFTPADPKVFIDPIMSYVKAMASLTQTPLHYFQNNGQFASGQALRTAEAPLIKKVHDRQVAFGSTWRDVFRFALKIEGIETDVQVRWQIPDSIDPSDSWTIAQAKKIVGIPLLNILLEMGYDQELAEEIVKTAEENAKKLAEAGVVSGGSTGGDPTASVNNGLNQHNLALQQQAAERRASQSNNAQTQE